MNQYFVDSVSDAENIYYYIYTNDLSIIKEPTKYLKHKVRTHCSPNTVKRIAYAITYYLTYLTEQKLTINLVLEMNYSEQYEHFVNFLQWLHSGKHCDRNKLPNNNTCNSYLQSVFGYYTFILLEYENSENLRVLERRNICYSGVAGVRFSKCIQTFGGYLSKEKSVGRTIEKDKIITLLEFCNNVRDQLIILLLAETGFRIGELLGIRYTEDIDYENKTIKVEYRENNENMARAKRAEYRWAKISDETFDILTHYISENRKVLLGNDYLFVNLCGKTKGKPLTVNGVYSVLRLLNNKTGIKATPHMLRHYFANERRKAGWPLCNISTALGHKSTYTTEKYINIEDEELIIAMDEYYKKSGGIYNIDKLI